MQTKLITIHVVENLIAPTGSDAIERRYTISAECLEHDIQWIGGKRHNLTVDNAAAYIKVLSSKLPGAQVVTHKV